MKRSDILKQTRASKIEAQGNMLKARKAEKRDAFNEDETKKFNQLNTEIENLDEQIRQAETEENAETRAAALAAPVVPATDGGETQELRKMQKRFSIAKALRSTKGQTGVEKEINDMAIAEARAAGVNISDNTVFTLPGSMMRADQHTVSQDSGEYGAELVKDNAPIVQEGFLPKLFLEEAGATVLDNLSDGKVPLPVTGGYELQWLAETASNDITKEKITGPLLDPKRASAGVSFSNRLLMQSSQSVDALLMGRLGKGAAIALQRAAINGPGGVAPTGILNTTGILTAADVAGAAPTWKKILELSGLIESNDATDQSVAYLLRPSLAAYLKSATKDAGSGRFIMENGMLDGKKTIATSLVDELAGPLQSLIYGDFSQLFIGIWAGASFIVDPYTQAGADSKVIHVNMHADVAVAQPKAFAVNNFLDIS